MSRKKQQRKGIALGTICAVTLSLSLLVGCTRPPMSTLSTTSTSGPIKAQAGAPGVGTSNSTLQGVPLSFLTITGKATFQGQPLANAELRVVDALSDKAAPVVAAGGGNVVAAGGGNVVAAGGGNVVAAGGGNVVAAGGGNIVAAGGSNIVAAGGGNVVAAGGGNIVAAGGGNIVAAGGGNIVAAGGGNIVAAGGGNLRTDAQGNFSVQVAGLTGGNAARLVVAAGGSAVSTLVTGGGGLMGKYTIQQADGSMQASIDEVTTTVGHLANGTLRLSRLLRAGAAGPIVAEMIDGLQSNAELFQEEFHRQPGLANELVQETDPTTGAPKSAKKSILPVIIGNSGTRRSIFDLNKKALKSIAQAANDPQNQAPNMDQVQQELQDVPLAGTGLTVSLTDTSLSVHTSTGGTIDLSTSDSNKLDAALNSAGFEKTFAPPTSNSNSPTSTPTPSPTPNPIVEVGTVANLPGRNTSNTFDVQAGAVARDATGRFWVTDTAHNFVGRALAETNQMWDYDTVKSDPGVPVCAGDTAWIPHNSLGQVIQYNFQYTATITPYSLPALEPNIAVMPKCLTIDPIYSRIWVSDWGVNAVSRWTGTGFASMSTTNINAQTVIYPGITKPEGLATDTTGKVWILSGTDGKILVLRGDGTYDNTYDFSGSLTAPLSAPTPGDPSARPLVLDSQERAWFPDKATNRVFCYDRNASPSLKSYAVQGGPEALAVSGSAIWVLSKNGHGLSRIDPGAATPVISLTLTYAPGGMTTDTNGNVYLTDPVGKRIVKYNFPSAQIPGI